MTLKNACETARSAREAQASECDADAAAIEDSYCAMRNARDAACADYDTCYDEKTHAMAKKLDRIKELENTTKQHFQTMACAGEAFGDGAAAEEQECDPNSYETNHLDVSYPNTPAKQSCVSIIHTAHQNYSGIVCSGNGAAATPAASNLNVTGAAPGPTAAAPGTTAATPAAAAPGTTAAPPAAAAPGTTAAAA